MRAGEEGCLVVGEGIEEDGQQTGEESGQASVVDQVEEPDLGPRRRSTGENGPRLLVVNHVTHAHLGYHVISRPRDGPEKEGREFI